MLQFLDLDKKIKVMFNKKHKNEFFIQEDDLKKMIEQYSYIDEDSQVLNSKKMTKKIGKAQKKGYEVTLIKKDLLEGFEIKTKNKNKTKVFKYFAVSPLCLHRCAVSVDLINSMSEEKYFSKKYINNMALVLFYNPNYDITEFDEDKNSDLCSFYLYQTVENLLSEGFGKENETTVKKVKSSDEEVE